MKTIVTFIKENGITMTTQRILSRENNDIDCGRDARHWNVTLVRGNHRLKTQFTQGSAHTEPPTIEEMLDCLVSDALSVDENPERPPNYAFKARPFEDWCGDFGYDPDSRKAEKVYSACVDVAKKLRSLLTSPGRSSSGKYTELLTKVERP